MRGISFNTQKNDIDNKDFLIIFDSINFDDYMVQISYQEFYDEIKIPEKIFWKDLKIFCEQTEFRVIFLEAFIYKKDVSIKGLPCNYNEYILNPCVGVIFITDSAFVEIYCKDNVVNKKIKDNIATTSYCNQRYITDENDGRTKFSVW